MPTVFLLLSLYLSFWQPGELWQTDSRTTVRLLWLKVAELTVTLPGSMNCSSLETVYFAQSNLTTKITKLYTSGA